VTPEIAARLATGGIELATETKEYSMFVRGNCMCLVRSAGGRFTSVGSTGVMTEQGLAYLVWAEGKAWLSTHGRHVEADAAQVDEIRKFSEDLRKILEPPAFSGA
jgi:hypothetical protein